MKGPALHRRVALEQAQALPSKQLELSKQMVHPVFQVLLALFEHLDLPWKKIR